MKIFKSFGSAFLTLMLVGGCGGGGGGSSPASPPGQSSQTGGGGGSSPASPPGQSGQTGGGGGSSPASPPGQSDQTQARALLFSDQYSFGPLSAPTGQPIFLKTVVGDLDGDGRNDVVTFSNATVNGSDVVVIFQDQSGTFTFFASANSASDLGLTGVYDIAVGDLNGDGRADLAILGIPTPVTIDNGPQFVVFYQDSTGDLGSPVRYTVTNASKSLGLWFAIGDVNSDGRNDVVFSGSPARVMLQASDGSLADTASVFTVNATILGEVRIADMDADGDKDIVYQAGDKTIGILRQVASGILSGAPESYPVTTSYWRSFNTFAVGDVNGDGKNDVVVVDPGNSGFLNIFLQNSSGTLNAPQLVTITPATLDGIEIADVNQDGLNDILDDGAGGLHVLYQKADHTFQSPTVYGFPTSAGGGSISYQSLSIGDVTGDGWPDAVVTWMNEGIFVLMNVPNDV